MTYRYVVRKWNEKRMFPPGSKAAMNQWRSLLEELRLQGMLTRHQVMRYRHKYPDTGADLHRLALGFKRRG